MLQGDRSFTPPTEVRRLTDPTIPIVRKVSRRRYHSEEILRDLADGLCANGTHLKETLEAFTHAPKLLSGLRKASRSKEKPHRNVKPARLSSLLPILWPTLRGKKMSSKLPASRESSYEQALRHHTASHRPSLDKGSIAPPVLTPATPIPIPPTWVGEDPKSIVDQPPPRQVPRRESSVTKHLSPHEPTPEPQPPGSTVTSHPAQNPAKINPQSQNAESPWTVDMMEPPHSADLRSSGVTPPSGVQTQSSETVTHLFPFGYLEREINAHEPLTGVVFRRMTGGDICEDVVDVTAHRHLGHGASAKIRSAFGLPLLMETSHKGHQDVSKVLSTPQSPSIALQSHERSTTPSILSSQEEPVLKSDGGHEVFSTMQSNTANQTPGLSQEVRETDSKIELALLDDAGVQNESPSNWSGKYDASGSANANPRKEPTSNLLQASEIVLHDSQSTYQSLTGSGSHEGHGRTSKVNAVLPVCFQHEPHQGHVQSSKVWAHHEHFSSPFIEGHSLTNKVQPTAHFEWIQPFNSSKGNARHEQRDNTPDIESQQHSAPDLDAY